MAERPPLIHPKMKDFLPEQYPDLCTIQELTEDTDEWGETTYEWQNLAGHIGLPALIAPSGGREVKQDDKTYTVSDFYISLKGYYPGIDETMQAVVSGQEYNVLLVEHASRQTRTRLTVEVVR